MNGKRAKEIRRMTGAKILPKTPQRRRQYQRIKKIVTKIGAKQLSE